MLSPGVAPFLKHKNMNNEAFERAKSAYGTGAYDDATMEFIFPQLRESEDERIRTNLVALVKAFGQGKYKNEMLAYLEKQKEPHFTKRNALFDKCVEDCDPKVMKEVSDKVDAILEKEQKPAEIDEFEIIKKHITEDSLSSEVNKRLKECGWYVTDEKPAQTDDEKEYIRTIKSIIADFIRDKKPEVAYYQRIYDWLDGRHIEQKPVESWPNLSNCKKDCKVCFAKCLYRKEENIEQKPAEKQDYSGLSDLERAIHRGLLCAGVENVPVEIIKETARDCLAQMKPAEWSEEDENALKYLHELIGFGYSEKFMDAQTAADMREWVNKSLRPQPHWKPSEEEEEPEYYQHFDPDC